MHRLASLLFLLLPLACFSQVNIINRNLTDSSLNVAYIGVDNEIELRGVKNNSGTILFSTTNGTITTVGQNRYTLRPLNPGECTLTFSEKGKFIAQKNFNIDFVPSPIARFSNWNDSIQIESTKYLAISLTRLISDPTLRVYAPRCFLKDKGQILSYRITCDGLGFEDQDEIFVTGSRLTDEQVKKITKRFSKRNYMYVDEIRCLLPGGRILKLAPLSYLVSN